MKLKPYLFSMSMPERERFAVRCGTSYGHIRNVAYEQKPCAEELAVAIEKESGGAVPITEMHAQFAALLKQAGYVRAAKHGTPEPTKEAA